MIKQLRRKFIIIAMCSVFAVLVIIIGIINICNYSQVVKNADGIVEILQSGGGSFDGMGGEGVGMPDMPSGPSRPMSPEMPFETRFFTVEFDNDGHAVAVNTNQIAAIDEAQARQYAEHLYNKEKVKGFYGNYRYGVASTQLGGRLYIFVDCTRELTSFRTFLYASIAVGASGLAVVFLLVFLLSGKIIKPVAESYSKQKRFITDASHEIKTPLTIIGANVDIMEMQDGENEFTAEIKTQVKRLTSLTDKLVFLAKMDEDTQRINTVEFSVSAAVDEIVNSFASVALSRGHEINSEIAPNIFYSGDEGMIRQAITLLVDNALKYSAPDGNIDVRLSSANGKIRFSVSNREDSLPDGELNFLFERFYRADSSRSSETGGHGIGLSVVKSILTAHKGRITARKGNGVVTFTVIL